MRQRSGGLACAPTQVSVAVLIPALNAANTLVDVVEGVRASLVRAEILVVDDGSTDNTASVAKGLGCRVLQHPRNAGKGAALRTGFEAVGKRAEVILTLDADGQHDPREIPALLQPVRAAEADVVVGNRMWNWRGMPLDRYLSNRLSSLVVSWMAGVPIPDSQCGFRAFRREVVAAISLTTSRFETESEFLVQAARAGFRIGSVPIATRYTANTSAMSRCADTLRFARLMVKLVTESRKYGG